MTLVRDGEQYDFVIQGESLALAGAAIQSDDDQGRWALAERVAAIRCLSETVDQLYTAFLKRRLGRQWSAELSQTQTWLATESHETIRRAG